MRRAIITGFYLTCIIFALTGCAQSTWLYRVNVQQGNIINQDMIRQLRVGMPKEAVCEIMGPPILVDTFNENRWVYIYTLKSNRKPFVQKHLVIYFVHNRICKIFSSNIQD